MDAWVEHVRDKFAALLVWLGQFIADARAMVSRWLTRSVAGMRGIAPGRYRPQASPYVRDKLALLWQRFNPSMKRGEAVAASPHPRAELAVLLHWFGWFIERVYAIVGIGGVRDKFAFFLRWFAWSAIGIMAAYLLNCYLSHWQNWPSALALVQKGEFGVLALLQTAFYPLAIYAAAVVVLRTAEQRTLRDDSKILNDIVNFIIRAAFWAVLLVGLVDALISFLRVEGLLEYIVGNDLAKALARAHFRGSYVHIPLCIVGIYIAARRTTIDFIWLSLLVVAAELTIVVTRFVFSYEQIFMGDLVRFWYAALFLFASAYTLYSDAHVRVDVFYASFSRQQRSAVNAVGALLLGVLFCWTILTIGMWSKTSILIAPLLGFEISQSSFGMYVKYLMAGFLSIFAVTMTIQFISSLLASAADYRGDPGGRETDLAAGHSTGTSGKEIKQ